MSGGGKASKKHSLPTGLVQIIVLSRAMMNYDIYKGSYDVMDDKASVPTYANTSKIL